MLRRIIDLLKKRKYISKNSKTCDDNSEIENELREFAFGLNKESLERQWEKLSSSYDCVFVHFLDVECIGELIARYEIIIDNTEKGREYDLFIPRNASQRVCNIFLIEYLSRNLNIVSSKNMLFWAFMFEKHRDFFDFSQLRKYSMRNNYPPRYVKVHRNNYFTQKEIESGEQFLSSIGLDKSEFICFNSRSSSYNECTLMDFNEKIYSYRNTTWDNYSISIERLNKKGVSSVRVGRESEKVNSQEGLIDYSGLYATDFLDLFLISKCKMLVAPSSGINEIAALFGVPQLTVNFTPFSFGAGGLSRTREDMFITKKYYDKDKERYLSLVEMCDVEMECLIWDNLYYERGIVIEENSPEEIYDAVVEVLSRMDGTWIDGIEERLLEERYAHIKTIIDERVSKNSKIWTGGMINTRICTSFLKKNEFLLDI